MPDRVSTERIRGHVDELFAQDKALPETLEASIQAVGPTPGTPYRVEVIRKRCRMLVSWPARAGWWYWVLRPGKVEPFEEG